MAFTHELVAECLQFEQAFCTAACPFNLDIRDFIGKIRQGRFNVAYKAYQNTVGFPGIVTALCPEPCKPVCPMKDAGGAISLRELEKASMAHARSTDPDNYNVPSKGKRIAIIGAGVSGLACALRLASRKYQVTVFEKTGRIGGHLHEILSPEVFMADFELQFKYESYELRLNTEIIVLDNLGFDAVYVATGKGGNAFGLEPGDEFPFATSRPGTFIGGSVTGSDTMNAINHGLNAANAIETWLKIRSMAHPYTPVTTKLPYDAVEVKPAGIIVPADGKLYTKEEAVAESQRCLQCCCDACNRHSPLMNYFKKFPKRITEEVQVSLTPSSLDGAAKLATRYISTCTHCGLCKEVCPKDIDTGKFLLQSHRTMRKQGTMPWAFHEFYLRDMDFSIKEAGLFRIPPGYDKSSFLFFPGCQMGASNPEYVVRSYRFLLDRHPDTAIYLGCCGAPAEWAGDEDIHSDVINGIHDNWIKAGKPVVIFACPMCRQMFGEYLPEVQAEFLYSFLELPDLSGNREFEGITASVYDPCASRHEPALQDHIRKLATAAGFKLDPLPMEGNLAECCSYGGHVAITHPPYTEHMINKRIVKKDTPYITYCSNCRDIFSTAGKQAWHILDIIFGIGDGSANGLTVTERQTNRLVLKKQLLNEIWKEEITLEDHGKRLEISLELKDKLHKNYILESDLLQVIEYCEQSNRKLFDPDKQTFTGYHQVGNMTYWVEYKLKGGDVYELINGYCHRMKIEE